MRIPIIALAAAAVAGPALAAAPSAADQQFLTQDVQGARYELALARLAFTRATIAPVRAYATRIVHDHTQANVALTRLAKKESVNPPSGMTSQDQATLDRLKGMNGNSFDKAYVDEVTRINNEDQQQSDKEKNTTQDQRIKTFLQHFSSMDDQHKEMGEQLKSKIG